MKEREFTSEPLAEKGHFSRLVFPWKGLWEPWKSGLVKKIKNYNQEHCENWWGQQWAARRGSPGLDGVREEVSEEGTLSQVLKNRRYSPVEKMKEGVSGRGNHLEKGWACLWLLPFRWAASGSPWAVFAFDVHINLSTQGPHDIHIWSDNSGYTLSSLKCMGMWQELRVYRDTQSPSLSVETDMLTIKVQGHAPHEKPMM